MTKNNRQNKNIRQAHNELERRFKELTDAHLILQRTVKLILLSQEPITLSYKNKIAERYTLHEVDALRLEVRENEELNTMEISLGK